MKQFQSRRAQSMLESLLLMAMVAVIVIMAFRNSNNSGALNAIQTQAQEYFDSGSRAVTGGYYDGASFISRDPQAINGDWCAWGICINGVQERDCACPRPAFGGSNCYGAQSQPCGGGGATCPEGQILLPGGGCGCPPGKIIRNGVCVVCTPQCIGRQCGDDTCDGVCGTCNPNQNCVDGVCQLDCTPNCLGRECGPDGCPGNGICGICPPNLVCQLALGRCVGVCEPYCPAGQCGDDGCSGPCTCPAGQVCAWGNCITELCSGNACSNGSGSILPGCITPMDCALPCPPSTTLFCSDFKLCNGVGGYMDVNSQCIVPDCFGSGKTNCCVKFCVGI